MRVPLRPPTQRADPFILSSRKPRSSCTPIRRSHKSVPDTRVNQAP